MHPQKKHAILTCFDDRLDPVIGQYEEGIRKAGGICIRPVRPIGGIHFMTREKCSNFLCGQVHGFIDIVGVNCIDLLLHTDCKFNRQAHHSRLEKAESDMAFQIATLEKVHRGVTSYIKKHFSGKSVELSTRIIHTEKVKILTLEEAKSLLPDHHHHHRRNGTASHQCCHRHEHCLSRTIAPPPVA